MSNEFAPPGAPVVDLPEQPSGIRRAGRALAATLCFLPALALLGSVAWYVGEELVGFLTNPQWPGLRVFRSRFELIDQVVSLTCGLLLALTGRLFWIGRRSWALGMILLTMLILVVSVIVAAATMP